MESSPTLSVALVVEDLRFEDFLVPAIQRLAAEVGTRVRVVSPVEKLHGCNARLMGRMVARLARECDVVVVGADAAGRMHGRSERSYRQKAQLLTPYLGPHESAVSLAVAEPSVEAWLLADLSALAKGIGAGMGRELSVPAEVQAATTERLAKTVLGRVTCEIAGDRLSRSGFEFAPEIVARIRLANSTSESLAAWARDLRLRLSPSTGPSTSA